jgi:hypothetical protein
VVRFLIVFIGACTGNGAHSPDGALPAKRGFVSIQSYDAMNVPGTPTRGGAASAGFYAIGDVCLVTQHLGPCDLAQCDSTPPEAISAGTITITGAAAPMIVLAPAADQTYAPLMSTTPLFSGGESVTFSAAGAAVPVFTESITTPAKATITVPAEPPASAPFLIVNRAQDFTVSWSGGGSGQLQVALNSEDGSQRLFCRFAASAGTGKLPSAALSLLPSGTGGFAMASIAVAVHVAGDWAVDVSAYFNAVWPDASIVSGPAALQ